MNVITTLKTVVKQALKKTTYRIKGKYCHYKLGTFNPLRIGDCRLYRIFRLASRFETIKKRKLNNIADSIKAILFNFLFFIVSSLDARLNILYKRQSPIRRNTKHGSHVTLGHEESTDQTSILCKSSIFLLVWYLSNCQDIYAWTDEIFEQKRKSETRSGTSGHHTRASYVDD